MSNYSHDERFKHQADSKQGIRLVKSWYEKQGFMLAKRLSKEFVRYLSLCEYEKQLA
jgi:hypothetical protein